MNLLASLVSDPAMAFLARGLDVNSAAELLGRALGRKVAVTALHVVRHKPGRRSLIEYELASGEKFVGKVRAKGANNTAFDVLQRLWNSGFNDDAPDRIRVPQPFAIIAELKMILLRKEPGQPTTDFLVRKSGLDVAARVADVAHKLHTSRVTPTKTHSIADELKILDERLAHASQLCPEWSQRIAKVRGGCHQLAATLGSVQSTSIHRDFYPAQVLIDGPAARDCCVLDLDSFSLGDAALDIGNFIGHLAELGLREHDSAGSFAEQEEAMVKRYVELAPAVSRERIEVYRLLTLARHIFISTQFPERQHATERLLEYCERKF